MSFIDDIWAWTRGGRERKRREWRHENYERWGALAHLTEEQWEAHKEAYADYRCQTGKYKDIGKVLRDYCHGTSKHPDLGLIDGWLENEGLPSVPEGTPRVARSV